jgi:hypothetical protein
MDLLWRKHFWKGVAAVAVTLTACGGGGGGGGDLAGMGPLSATVTTASATFSGARGNYTITRTSSGYSVKDNAGSDGTTAVASSAGSLVFSDYTVNLGVGDKSTGIAAADLKLLVELYIAFFNRVPDADGLSFWIDQFAGGRSIDLIADDFYGAAVQASAVTGYSASMTNSDFVRIIYENVLGRSGDTAPPDEDVAFWADRLASGASTRGSLIGTMLVSAHSFKGDATWGWVADLLDNKYTVGSYFAVQQGLNFKTAADNITQGAAIAAAVTPTTTTDALALIGVADTAFSTISSDTDPGASEGGPLLALSSNTTVSLDSCGGTIGAGVPEFYRNYFMCSNRSLSADGNSIVISFYSLPPYTSPYYPATHPNYLAFATDRAQSVQCGNGQQPGTGGCYLKNPNTLAQQSFTLTIPLNPTARGIDVNASASQVDNTSGDPLDYTGAVMGVAANGVALFSAFAAPGDDIAEEAYTFDSHEGHPQNSGVYHYHAYSPAPLEVMRKAGFTTSITPGAPAGGVEFYGITCDGVLILGATELDGTTPVGALDAQGGHAHDLKDKAGTQHFSGRYHVHLSPSPVGTNSKAYRYTPELRYYSTCNSS